jgi:hypothetical protein
VLSGRSEDGAEEVFFRSEASLVFFFLFFAAESGRVSAIPSSFGRRKKAPGRIVRFWKKSGFLLSIYHRNRGKKSGKYSRFLPLRRKPSVEKDVRCGILVCVREKEM